MLWFVAVVTNYMIPTDGELFLSQSQCLTLRLVKHSGCEFLPQRHKSPAQPNVTTELHSNHTESGYACINRCGMDDLTQVLSRM